MPMSFDVERYVRCGASARTRCGATATVFPRAIDKSTNRPSRTLYVTATKSATRSRPTAVEVVGCKSSAARGSLRGVTGVPLYLNQTLRGRAALLPRKRNDGHFFRWRCRPGSTSLLRFCRARASDIVTYCTVIESNPNKGNTLLGTEASA